MPPVLGLIIAGGKAERFGGGDKCLRLFQGRPLLSHILERLSDQTNAQALSANGDPARFEPFSLPVLADGDRFQDAGPIAGLITGLHHAQALGMEFVMTVPGDAPLFPLSLKKDLRAILGKNDCARAESGDSPHPIFALWRTSCLEAVERAATNRTRALWRVQQNLATVTLPYDNQPYDPFCDADTPEDLARLELIAAEYTHG